MLKFMTLFIILSGIVFSSDQVEKMEITKDSEVLIYSAFFWTACKEAKSLLQSRGIEYEEKMITFSRKHTKEMAKVTNGQTEIPQILIDGKYVGGLKELKIYFENSLPVNWSFIFYLHPSQTEKM